VTRLAPGLVTLAAAAGLAVHYLWPSGGERTSGAPPERWSAIGAGEAAGVDSLVVALLAKLPEDGLASLDEYLGDDDDVISLVYDLPRDARQSLITRLTGLMKLKG